MQSIDFALCMFFFRPAGQKKNIQKKKRTMLPQAIATFA
jgi:hypothetical protein